MSLLDFQLLDNEPFDNSINRRHFLKNYHQQGASFNDRAQNVKFIFGENNEYHQAGNSHLGFDVTVRKADCNNFNFTTASATNEVNNAFAYSFEEAALSTTGGTEIEQVKFLRQVLTIMRALTSKDGDLSSHFDKIDETKKGINNTSLKQMLNNNHTDVNRGNIHAHLPLEHMFGFCITFKKVTKNLGFHLTFRKTDLQGIIFTTFANFITIKINSFYSFVPLLIPNTKTSNVQWIY